MTVILSGPWASKRNNDEARRFARVLFSPGEKITFGRVREPTDGNLVR